MPNKKPAKEAVDTKRAVVVQCDHHAIFREGELSFRRGEPPTACRYPAGSEEAEIFREGHDGARIQQRLAAPA